MAEMTTGSTVPRRQLGRFLRELRHKNGMTIRRAGELLEWSEAKMWRIETGQSAMRSLDVQTMCQLYGADPDLTEALMGLAKETKARGWWHAYGDVIPEGFDIYIGLEEAAASIDWYESDLVPGLLQTEAYAREVITQDNSDKGADEIDRRIHLRLSRQRILSRTTAPPQLRVTLNESILRRPVGSPVLMAGQLQYLAEVSELPNVSMRVVPFSRGFHPGVLSGPFLVLRFPRSGDGRDSEPPTVYSDGFTGALYLDKPAEIDRYEPAFTAIWATALEERISRTLILQAAKELQP